MKLKVGDKVVTHSGRKGVVVEENKGEIVYRFIVELEAVRLVNGKKKIIPNEKVKESFTEDGRYMASGPSMADIARIIEDEVETQEPF